MTVFTKTITAVSILLLLSTVAVGQISDDPIKVETLVVTPAEDAVEFTVNSTEWVRYTYFELEGPRLVVDFHNAESELGFWRREVDHAGVTQVRSSFFTDDNREATRLVFDLEKEVPYEIIDEGEGKVRVRFGAEDASRLLTDVTGQAAADWFDGDGLENLELLSGPLEATLLDQDEIKATLLSDLGQT